MDRASNSQENNAGLIVANLDRVIAEYALRFNFNTTNNIAEYDALIVGLKIPKELSNGDVRVFLDSQLSIS